MNRFEIIPFVFNIRNKPANIKDYQLFKEFCLSKKKRKLLKGARQVAKTTFLSMDQILKIAFQAPYYLLNIHPSDAQTKKFSQINIDEALKSSSVFKSLYNRDCIYNVHLKTFTNGSVLHFSYVGIGPERLRGISVQEINFDEIQSIYYEDIPVVEQCASSYADSKFVYAGTPGTSDNTIETLWKLTNQIEPFLVCSRCNFENFCILPDVFKMLNEKFLVCQKCGRQIEKEVLYNAKTIPLRPEITDFDGWHIPQIFTTLNNTPQRWAEIIRNRKVYSDYTFITEVLGISYDTGGRPITLEKLRSLCLEKSTKHFTAIAIGVDWGCATEHSLTAICVTGLRQDGKFEVILGRKYNYRDRLEQISEIVTIFKDYNCTCIGCDNGVGLTDNLLFRKHLGSDKIYEFLYMGQGKLITYDEKSMVFHTSKRKTLNMLFFNMNTDKIFFPKYELISDFFNDILSETEEIRGTNKLYNHNPNIPDDFLHALNFSILALKLCVEGTILDQESI